MSFKKGIPLGLLFFTFMIAITSCKIKSDIGDAREPRIAKQVPDIILLENDSLLQKGNDTVYYRQKLYSGYMFSLGKNGDTLTLNSYFNGVEEGFQRKWFAKGKPEELRFYVNGKKEGLQQGWWQNGNPRFKYTAFDNEYEGKFEEWMDNGLLIKRFNYKNGYEIGRQQLWWANGKIRANYDIIEGRKYGLLGYKLCSNPYDSINGK